VASTRGDGYVQSRTRHSMMMMISPMASPIVCVTKKDGGIRITVDYRYLNSFTVGDAFPMSTVNETLLKLGNAKFISTFDAKSGYWQIPIAEQD